MPRNLNRNLVRLWIRLLYTMYVLCSSWPLPVPEEEKAALESALCWHPESATSFIFWRMISHTHSPSLSQRSCTVLDELAASVLSYCVFIPNRKYGQWKGTFSSEKLAFCAEKFTFSAEKPTFRLKRYLNPKKKCVHWKSTFSAEKVHFQCPYSLLGLEVESLSCWKPSFLKSQLITNVLELLLKRYLFTSGENHCSCAVEFVADACAVDLYEKLAQLSFQTTNVQR